MAKRRATSQRAAAMYIGVEAAVFGRWLAGSYKPTAESCELIAAWAGLPLTTVLEAAGRIPRGRSIDAVPPPHEEFIDAELGILLRRFTPDEQRRIVLPAVRLVAELREEFEPPQPTPPGHPTPPPPAEAPPPGPPDAPPA
jgi:transcriptional regulator with XRE-family HTH domain